MESYSIDDIIQSHYFQLLTQKIQQHASSFKQHSILKETIFVNENAVYYSLQKFPSSHLLPKNRHFRLKIPFSRIHYMRSDVQVILFVVVIFLFLY